VKHRLQRRLSAEPQQIGAVHRQAFQLDQWGRQQVPHCAASVAHGIGIRMCLCEIGYIACYEKDGVPGGRMVDVEGTGISGDY
jgi:hypothetical protein